MCVSLGSPAAYDLMDHLMARSRSMRAVSSIPIFMDVRVNQGYLRVNRMYKYRTGGRTCEMHVNMDISVCC